MGEIKKGDRVRVLRGHTMWMKLPGEDQVSIYENTEYKGKIGIVNYSHKELTHGVGNENSYSINIDGENHSWFDIEQLELVKNGK